MRLLSTNADGSFSLTHFMGTDVPSYAVLSHTWEADEEEVMYFDLIKNTGSSKRGYRKIQFCSEQAGRDGVNYFWVDSCCIDKSSSAELQTAINSMFRWYRDAAKCYVYLSDVSACEDVEPTDLLPEAAFRNSRWFTRGWTLQELLAPQSVEFFSCEGTHLGDKDSLLDQIHDITGIAVEALQGNLSRFTADERRDWAVKRQTTIEEDQIYCLLGICDVFLPLIYGEGREHASRRLQDEIDRRSGDTQESRDTRCLTELRVTDPRHDKIRIEDTKGGLFQDASSWILDHTDFRRWHDTDEARLLWIRGDPGKGKTMLLLTIIDELERQMKQAQQHAADDSIVLSYFFCQGTSSDLNNATAVLRGLVYLLGDKYPSLVPHLRKRYDNAGSKLFKDVNAFFALAEVMEDMMRDEGLSRAYILIDALDECETGLQRLLNFIVHNTSTSPRVKWIVSSRNKSVIEGPLKLSKHKIVLSLELNKDAISTAINTYIDHRVYQLSQQKSYNSKMQIAVRDHLRARSNDTFLWVSLVCGDLEKCDRWKTMSKLKEFPPGLEPFYDRMMHQICASENVELFKCVLAIMTAVYQPVTLAELATIAELPEEISEDLESLEEVIGLCGSFLAIRDRTIYFVHQSVKDYLSGRASSSIFPSGPADVHRTIFSRSLESMSMILERNIYRLHHPGVLMSEVETPNPDPLVAIRYSCAYWIRHFCDVYSQHDHHDYRMDADDAKRVDWFFRNFTLYWLEALGLVQHIAEGVLSITWLETLVREKSSHSQLLDLVRDLRRFILLNRWIIETAPLQTYESALVFSPDTSLVRKIFKGDEPKWIKLKPVVETSWSPCLQSLEGHEVAVRSVSLSPDSKLLASGSDDCSIKIWDAATGAFQNKFDGHTASVWGITFSHNSELLASASKDGSVKIWEVATGMIQHTLHGHESAVWYVTFSHNSKRLASASDDGSIRIWDVVTGTLHQKLEYSGYSVWGIALSHNAMLLASASSDSCVRIWSLRNAALQHTLKGHKSSINNVVFLKNSSSLASASDDMCIKIWDVATGALQHTLEGHSSPVNSIAFLHDLNLLASASDDGTVKIWDVALGTLQQTLKGHGSAVQSVAFSQNSQLLASGSFDGAIKTWDISARAFQEAPNSHRLEIRSVAFSTNSELLASVSFDGTIKIWDSATGILRQILNSDGLEVKFVSFVKDQESNLLVLTSSDGSVRIWDVSTEAFQQTLEGNKSWINTVAFSYNSKFFASVSDDAIKIWDTATGDLQQTLKSQGLSFRSASFAYDSKLLASGSDDGSVDIWNIATGVCLQTLKCDQSPIHLTAFSYDFKLIASVSHNSVRIWDIASGALQQTFSDESAISSVTFIHGTKFLALSAKNGSVSIRDIETGALQQSLQRDSSPVWAITLSYDGKFLASASDSYVKIWDLETGTCQKTLGGHGSPVWGLAFSREATLLASASSNGCIKIWDTVTGAVQQTFEGDGWGVWSVAFSDDSKLLASALDDRFIRIWDVATGALRQTLHISATSSAVSLHDNSAYLNDQMRYIEPVDKVKAPISTEVLSQCSELDQASEAKLHDYGISCDRAWITWNDYNVLWLPPSYRPSASAISSSTSPSVASNPIMVALGSGSGRVTVMGLSASAVFGRL